MQLPAVLNWYQTPKRVSLKQTAKVLAEVEDKLREVSSARSSLEVGDRGGIPKRLSLERVLHNKTCTPMSLHDFYMYLTHIEFSPENLEFYLWFKDYEKRWAKNPIAEEHMDPASSEESLAKECNLSTDSTAADSDDDLERQSQKFSTELEEGPLKAIIEQTLANCEGPCAQKEPNEKKGFTSFVKHITNARSLPEDQQTPMSQAELKAAYRRELDSIIVTYLLPSSPKELNLPSNLRNTALKAISHQTSPSHLRAVAAHCYILLKSCSHRNFVRLGVGNGTFETLCIATTLGIVLTLAGFLYMLCIAFATDPGHLRQESRWKGLGAFPLWWLGMSFILSGVRGSCFFLLLVSRRQPLPWERFDDDASITVRPSGVMAFMNRMMIFDRKLRVKDKVLRDLQRKIVLQSVGGGFLISILLCTFWLCLPIWQPLGQ